MLCRRLLRNLLSLQRQANESLPAGALKGRKEDSPGQAQRSPGLEIGIKQSPEGAREKGFPSMHSVAPPGLSIISTSYPGLRCACPGLPPSGGPPEPTRSADWIFTFDGLLG